MTALFLSLGLIALVWSSGCRRHEPDIAPKHPAVARPAVAPPVHVSRPRGPTYRLDNGLGSPVA